MTTATARADLSVVKARQQRTWARGGSIAIPATYLETILTLR